MSLLEAQDWTFPIPIAYGPGRLNEIGSMCSTSGMTRPLIVTDRGSQELPFIAELVGYLEANDLPSNIYADISPNPRDREIAAGREMFRQGDHDGIIAIGGGSGMDGGKAIALVANNELDLWTFEYDKTPPDMNHEAAFPPMICIPTTAGTGAETEGTAMITEVERMMKFCVWHPRLKPAFALLDPKITLALPRDLTAWTGCDAMVHAIEAYCVPAFHPLCDGVALEALRLIYRWLPTAVNEPSNLQARGGMLVGSCLGGIAFLKGLGMVHAISHMVGASYDTHHGLTNAVVLPSVLRFNAAAIEEKIPPMAGAMGLDDKSFDAFYKAVCDILDTLEIPKTLVDIGVPTDCATAIAEKALQDSAATTNPRQASLAEFQMVIEDALHNGR
ncbi:MAG: iron-containing alcohol dehydrogenase [Gammaproteobacteria bacterium]|nr:iron-containing alcohol dehydrogenase [Gammaproteobacteria bacterium]